VAMDGPGRDPNIGGDEPPGPIGYRTVMFYEGCSDYAEILRILAGMLEKVVPHY
jgi:hypothetical protein